MLRSQSLTYVKRGQTGKESFAPPGGEIDSRQLTYSLYGALECVEMVTNSDIFGELLAFLFSIEYLLSDMM